MAKAKAGEVPAGTSTTSTRERVPVVSRNADGTPNQQPGFVLVVPDNPTDAELAAAWNAGGELPPDDQPVEYVPRTS